MEQGATTHKPAYDYNNYDIFFDHNMENNGMYRPDSETCQV